MKRVILRLIRKQGLLLLLCVMLLFHFTGAKRVSAEEVQKLPYLIKVNRACNTITVYGKDENGKYTEPVKAMVCSVGRDARTVTGTFQTKEKYRWKELMNNVWGQYATRIVGGILFHSVYYYQNENPASLATKEFNKLGTAASHGCIRLMVADAKWIYDNCSSGTTVVIYDDKKDPGPLGKPESIKIPTTVRWDPTDPSDLNPYKDKMPKISGAKDIEIALGEKVDLLNGVKAKSSLGMDITSGLVVDGDVDTTIPGDYQITYYVKDALGKEISKMITVTVKGHLPVITLSGISDKVINDPTMITQAFALTGVDAYSDETILDKSCIKTTIEKAGPDLYTVTYQVMIDGEATVTKQGYIIIDRAAPVLSGIPELWMENGEVPSDEALLEGVTASDNYSKPEDIQIKVSLDQDQDGSFLVTYTATDEAGNSSTQQTKINN